MLLTNLKLLGQEPVRTAAGRICLADAINLRLGQFRGKVRFPVRLPALPASISHVVGLRSQEEVIGANASRVVAMVEDEDPVRYRAEVQFPGDTMRRSD